MDRGCRISGVKRIRVHDLRHSAISLLIDMGFSPLAIADRVGHEAIEITYNYAHLFPSKQQDMAKQLSQAMKEPSVPPDRPPDAPKLTLIKNESAA
jgi:integrase